MICVNLRENLRKSAGNYSTEMNLCDLRETTLRKNPLEITSAWFSTAHMQKIGNHTAILQIRHLPHGFFARARFMHHFQHKTAGNEQIDPFLQCSVENRYLEF